MEALQSHLGVVKYYPEPNAGALKARIAQIHGVEPGRVIVGNGSSELLFLFFGVVGPVLGLVVNPTFSEYARACSASGGTPLSYIPKNRVFPADLRDVAKASQGIKAVCLCNPNNPTGALIAGDSVRWLASALQDRDTWLVLDEAFMDFVVPEMRQGLLGPMERVPGNVFLLRSFTKMFSIPGLRLGWGMGPPGLIGMMEKRRDPWSVNSLAQVAGLACLEDASYSDHVARYIHSAREDLGRRLEGIDGIRVWPSLANFLLCEITRGGIGSADIVKAMAARRVLVRDASTFPGLGEGYFRVAVLTPEMNGVLAAELAEVMEGLASKGVARKPWNAGA
jgi:threonine-phosphate decarboxylase